MAFRPVYVIESIAITEAAYVAVTAPIDCNYWAARPPSDALVSSDPADASREDSLPAGVWEICRGVSVGNSPRYRTGDTVIYLKSDAGSGNQTVALRFLL